MVKQPHCMSSPLAIALAVAIMNITFKRSISIAPLSDAKGSSIAMPQRTSIQGKKIAKMFTQAIGRIRNAATASANSCGWSILPVAAAMKTKAKTILARVLHVLSNPGFCFTFLPLLRSQDILQPSNRGVPQAVSPLSCIHVRPTYLQVLWPLYIPDRCNR